jgi:hypothetical protein
VDQGSWFATYYWGHPVPLRQSGAWLRLQPRIGPSTVDIAAAPSAVRPRAELPLKLHQAPDPGVVGADVRFDLGGQFTDGGRSTSSSSAHRSSGAAIGRPSSGSCQFPTVTGSEHRFETGSGIPPTTTAWTRAAHPARRPARLPTGCRVAGQVGGTAPRRRVLGWVTLSGIGNQLPLGLGSPGALDPAGPVTLAALLAILLTVRWVDLDLPVVAAVPDHLACLAGAPDQTRTVPDTVPEGSILPQPSKRREGETAGSGGGRESNPLSRVAAHTGFEDQKHCGNSTITDKRAGHANRRNSRSTHESTFSDGANDVPVPATVPAPGRIIAAQHRHPASYLIILAVQLSAQTFPSAYKRLTPHPRTVTPPPPPHCHPNLVLSSTQFQAIYTSASAMHGCRLVAAGGSGWWRCR